MAGYGQVAHNYRAAGWDGVLPLPVGQKDPPPSGFTGKHADPDDKQIERWVRQKPNGNVALRMPDGIVGYDLDAYKPEGVATHAGFVATCGPLPATWVSANRDDDSGIRLYRVPLGTRLRGAFGGVEIIQRHHRYAVVWPSRHPEGRDYRWVGPDGQRSNTIPRRDMLPDLPTPWLEALAEPVASNGQKAPRVKVTGDWAKAVKDAYADAQAAMVKGSRHDAALSAACTLARFDNLGYPGAADALVAFGNTFVASISDRAKEGDAQREWDSIVKSAQTEVSSTPSLAPAWEQSFEHRRREEDEFLATIGSGPEPVATRVPKDSQPKPPPSWLNTYSNLLFPLDAYPPTLRHFVDETARSMPVHPDAVASLMLGPLGAAIGNRREIRMKADHPQRSRIWVCMIGRPSTRKSPLIDRVVAPLHSIQRDLDREYRRAVADWTDIAPKDRPAEPPRHKSVVVDDTTLEMLAVDLTRQPMGTLWDPDELITWLSSMGAYKDDKGGDRTRCLSIWSGKRWTTKRKTDNAPPIIVDHPHVSVIAGTQPGVAHKILEAKDGMPERFLYVVPPHVAGDATTDPVNPKVSYAYEELVRQLNQLDAPLGSPVVLKYAPGGYEEMVNQRQRLFNEEGSGELTETLESYWTKLDSYLGRITIILVETWRLCEGTNPDITPEIVQHAARIVDYFKGQALVVFGEGVAPPAAVFDKAAPDKVAALVRWVREQGETTLNEARRRVWALKQLSYEEAIKTAREALAAGDIGVQVSKTKRGQESWILRCVDE